MHTITVKGRFDADDLQTLTTALRAIDARHPDRNFTLLVFDPYASLEESEAMLRAALPPAPGRQTVIKRVPEDITPAFYRRG